MLKTNLMATGIGSIPETDSKKAIDLVDQLIRDMPFWPQLPNRAAGENMILQYAAYLPFIKIDRENNKLCVNDDIDVGTSLAELYENIEAARYEYFALTNKCAPGFYGFLDRYRKEKKKITFAKGHVTGSLTLAVSIDDLPEAVDKDPKRIIHNDTVMEILPAAVGMMGAWQVKTLSEVADRIIIFIDEPVLADYGSEVHPVKQSPDQLKAIINETIRQIRKGAKKDTVYVGMHCCGNSTWEHWLDTDLDIINFDSFSYWSHFYNRIERIREFINQGKILAFGIIPTAKDKLALCNKEGVWQMLKGQLDSLIQAGIDETQLIEQSLITPACGYGAEDPQTCRSGFELLMQVSDIARKEYRPEVVV